MVGYGSSMYGGYGSGMYGGYGSSLYGGKHMETFLKTSKI